MLGLLASAVLAAWPPVHDVVDVRAQEPNTGFGGCILQRDGAVRCWPSLQDPRFAGENWPRPSPVPIAGLEGVRQLGQRCSLTEKGEVRCSNPLSDTIDLGIAGAVETTDSCARLSDGGVNCWGSSLNCALGQRVDAPSCEAKDWLPPAPMNGLPALQKLEFGTAHCGLTEDGTLWCWGSSPLAAPPKSRRDMLKAVLPAAVAGVPKLQRFWSGKDLSIALTPEGRLLAWRRASYERAEEPLAIPGAERWAGVKQVAFGRSFVVFVLESGKAWLWGRDPAIPVSDSIPPKETDPLRPVPGLDDAVTVSAATEHACFATRSGLARCFGRNAEGQLGDGSLTTRPGAPPSEVVEIRPDALPEPTSTTCIATRELRVQCVEAGGSCSLLAPPEPQPCAGGMRRPDLPTAAASTQSASVATAPCLCTCSREFRDAQREAERRRDQCGLIPSAMPPTRPQTPVRPGAPAPAPSLH